MAASSEGGGSELLALLLHLGRRTRQAEDEAELAFILVNETHQLTPYRQAALALHDGGVVALSGVVTPEANAPYVQWLTRLFKQWREQPREAPWVIEPSDLSDADRQEWAQWLPAHAVCIPLPRVGQRFSGGALLLARGTAWSEGELSLLAEWAAIWAGARVVMDQGGVLSRLYQRLHGHSAAPADEEKRSLQQRARQWFRRRSSWVWLGVLLLLLLPVRLTVLAPAELVALNPLIVRAPIDGVIEQLHVMPNQQVSQETPLFEFDRTTIRNRLLVAERNLDTVRAELRQRSQQALFDEASKAQVAILQGEVAEKQVEVEYLRDLERRSEVRATREGIVLFDDPTEWVGRPVVTGERVMVIADEHKAEVEAWLSPADAITLEQGSRVRLYLNADPLQPLQASLRYVAHEAVQRPDGHYAYRVRATLQDADGQHRIGLKGTAKLEGERVAFIYWMLRRPLASLRAWLGV